VSQVSTLEQTVYDIAIRALRQQEEAITELRSRTGTLLTASSLIASFLGAQVIARGGLTIWVALALSSFGVSVVLCVYSLLPKDGLVFALDAPDTYAALADIRGEERECQYRLACWLHEIREQNAAAVGRVTRMFEVAAFALLTEIGFLAMALLVA
jgi:hypothetical protein